LKFPFISRWAHEQILLGKEELLSLKDAQIAELKEQAQQLADIISGAPPKSQTPPGATLDTSMRAEPYAPIVPDGSPAPKAQDDKKNVLNTDMPISIMRRGSVFARSVSARNSREYNKGSLRNHASKLLETAREEGLESRRGR
jgi:hypothetical protein